MRKTTYVLLILATSFVHPNNMKFEHRNVSFAHSMSVNPKFDQRYAKNNSQWQLAQRLYSNYSRMNNSKQGNEKIPLILHHIWLGSSLPNYAIHFRKSWIRKNPNWVFILWTDFPSKRHGNIILHSFDELFEYLKQPNKEQFIIMDMNTVTLKNQYIYNKKTKNYGEMSDIARYEILYNFGGLYVDTDFECLKPFDHFHYCLDFYTGIGHGRHLNFCNGLIGSAPGNIILKEAIQNLPRRPRYHSSMDYTGPNYFKECILDKIRYINGNAVLFPVTFFYPWPHQFRDQTHNCRRWIKQESYAFHYWKVSWQKGKGS